MKKSRNHKVIIQNRKKPKGFDPRIIKDTNPFIGIFVSEICRDVLKIGEECFHPVIVFRFDDSNFPEIKLEIDIWGLDELTNPIGGLFDSKPDPKKCKIAICIDNSWAGKTVRWENLINELIGRIEDFSLDGKHALSIDYLPQKKTFFYPGR